MFLSFYSINFIVDLLVFTIYNFYSIIFSFVFNWFSRLFMDFLIYTYLAANFFID